MTEADIQAQVLLALGSRHDVRLFRNHCAKGFTGEFVRHVGDLTILRNARRATFGIGNPGGADLLGFRSVTIGPEHVGRTLAQFLSVEVKATAGAAGADQRRWQQVVSDFGGLAGIARSPDDALHIAGLV